MQLRIVFINLFIFISWATFGQGIKTDIKKKEGIASYYHPKFNGRKTATGEIFSNQNMTGASNHFPLGTLVKVTNKKTGKSVIVKVNDRMAPNNNRVIDLTEKAARELCFKDQGLCVVVVESSDGTFTETKIIPTEKDSSK